MSALIDVPAGSSAGALDLHVKWQALQGGACCVQSFLLHLVKLLPSAEADPQGPEAARVKAVVFIRVSCPVSKPDIKPFFQECNIRQRQGL